MPGTFKYILLFVSNLEKSVKFYCDSLDFTLAQPPEDKVAMVKFGDALVILHYDDGDPENHFKGLKRRGQGVIVGFDVENVDAYYDMIHGRGAPVKEAPKDEPWGDRDFFVFDPDGYEIWFSQTIRKD